MASRGAKVEVNSGIGKETFKELAIRRAKVGVNSWIGKETFKQLANSHQGSQGKNELRDKGKETFKEVAIRGARKDQTQG